MPIGCGKPTGTVYGMVTYSGKPVTVGWVSFRDTAKGMVAAMSLGPDGTYQLRFSGGLDIPVGEYVVTVSPPAPTDEEIEAHEIRKFPNLPERYREPFTSPLRATVKPGENRFDIELADGEKTTGTVDGTVTYSGKPVTEGWVSFSRSSKGDGGRDVAGSGWDLPTAVQRRPGYPRGRVCRHSQPPADQRGDRRPRNSRFSEPAGEHIVSHSRRRSGRPSSRGRIGTISSWPTGKRSRPEALGVRFGVGNRWRPARSSGTDRRVNEGKS